jgi:glycosyltransferase involved in cell wall biosynthesis
MNHTKRATIAGVVLCLNEVENLPRALGSLGWCDELLMIDSGSTDGSQEVAMRCGASVMEHRQQGLFLITEQRNWALSHGQLQSQWVLFLDADEEVSKACQQAIQQAIQHPAAADAYELTPRYWFLGRWLKRTQGYPNWHPRLMKRGVVGFEGGVWESFTAGHTVGRIQEPYEHYAFSKGIDDWLERHQRYADWEAEKIDAVISGQGAQALGTRRWQHLRLAMAHAWPLRPILRFSQKYVIQGGFLEGWQGLLFALLMAGYDLITVVKLIERRRLKQGLPL